MFSYSIMTSASELFSGKRRRRFLSVSTFFFLLPLAPASFGADTETLEEVVVTGIRSSIVDAQEAKANADSVVDVISMQDLGHFPDLSLADALQRVPGVQVERNVSGNTGDRVAVRGLSSDFVTVTVNGRSPISAGTEGFNATRSFNFEQIPTDVLSSVFVYKTPESKNVANGIGGHIDFRTIRPLDLPYGDSDYTGTIVAKGVYDDYASDWGSKIGGLVGAKFADDTIGVFLSAEVTQGDRARDQFRVDAGSGDVRVDNDGDGIADVTLTDVTLPNRSVQNGILEEMSRTTFAAAVQFQPSEALSLTWDMLYSDFKAESDRQRLQPFSQDLFNNATTVFDAGSIVVDGNNVLQYFDGAGATTSQTTMRLRSGSFKYDNLTENLTTGLKAEWNATDRLNIAADVNYSEVEFFNIWVFPLIQVLVPVNDWSYDARNIDVPNYTFGPNIDDLSQYTVGSYLVNDNKYNADQVGAALDFAYDTEASHVSSIDFGFRYTALDAGNDWRRSNIALSPEDQVTYLANAFNGDSFDFMRGVDGAAPRSWPYSHNDPVNDALGIYDYSRGDLNNLPAQTYGIEEDVTAAYVQVNLAGQFGDLPYTANLGLRVEKTKTSASGTLQIAGQGNVPVTIDNDYTNALPSVNFKFEVKDDLNLRVGVSQTISRPDPTQIAPNIVVDSDPAVLQASGGNPHLDPYTATQLDMTVEYFTASEGMVVFSWFFKDVQDFIVAQTSFESVPGLDPNLIYTVGRPENYSDGEVTGFEIGFHQPFTTLPGFWSNFGLQMNYTFIESSFEKDDVGDSGFGFPGASQDNFNGVLYYDDQKLSVRLAYTYRSDYFNELPGSTGQRTNTRHTEGQGRLDAVIAYNFNEHLSVLANVTNITEEDRRDFTNQKTTFRDYFTQRRGATVGITYRF